MDGRVAVKSKALVLDRSNGHLKAIREFLNANDLVGVKALASNLMGILRSNVDLGAVFLAEDYGGTRGAGLLLAEKIHVTRPELPIFLQRDDSSSLDDLSPRERAMFRMAYTLDTLPEVRDVLDEAIFSRVYPPMLIRGISEFSQSALESQFKDCTIVTETPYLVKDRLIYGEVFSLIPIESRWCRGYLMLQAEERSLRQLIARSKAVADAASEIDFRHLNNVLGELTNLIWGAFKNRYVQLDDVMSVHTTQVPIIVNHAHKYISFGSEDPQLCFRHTVTDVLGENPVTCVIYERFVFNLGWSPEEFQENQNSVDALFNSGDLEMF